MPRKQFMKPVLRRIGDAGEDVGQPGLRIDVVEFRRHDQRRHGRRPGSAAFGAGKQPGFAVMKRYA